MKKGLLLLATVAVAAGLHGQESYMPFLEEGKVWTYLYYNDFAGSVFYESLAVKGDTTILGTSYKKIVDTATGKCKYTFREDGRKVYCRYSDDNESLIYDFSLNVGDTFYAYDDDDKPTVTSLYTITVGTRTFRVLDYRTDGSGFPVVWIEGIGGMIYMDQAFPLPGCYYTFYSCQLNGETLITQKDLLDINASKYPLKNVEKTSPLYDLQGRRVSGQPRLAGIYISGGRKIVK